MKIFFLFFLSCLGSINLLYAGLKIMDNTYVPARYVVISEKITADTAKLLSKKHKMNTIGTGGGLANCVNRLSLSFQIQGPLTKDQLRILVVDCVEEFLGAINKNKELRPYLKTYPAPFTINDIDITVFILDSCNIEVYDPFIGVVCTREDNLIYKTAIREDVYKFKSEFKESYRDAQILTKKS